MVKIFLLSLFSILFFSSVFSQTSTVIDTTSINGISIVCQGIKAQYTTNKTGGYWVSSDMNIARIDTVSGMLTSLAPGKVTVKYLAKSSNSLITSKQVIVLSNQPVQLSVYNNFVCVGSNIYISANTNSTGIWSSLNPSVATIGKSGDVTGVSVGSATIQYFSRVNGTCSDSISTIKVEVINTLPDNNVIIGTNRICANSKVQYSTKFPNIYSTTSDSTIVNMSGNTAFAHNPGTATISFKLNSSGSCPSKIVSLTVDVFQNPAKVQISGENILCSNCNGYLKTSFVGYRGVWTSNNTSKITVDSTGRVRTLGVDTATIYYNLPATSQCPSYSNSFKIKSVNANDLLKLTGNQFVDLDKSVIFKSSSPLRSKNYWYSCDSTIATVNSSTGEVTGKKSGSTTILYRSGSGSLNDTVSTRTIQVLSPADAGTLSGNQTLCIGTTTQLSSTNPRGTWSTSNLNIVSVSKSGLASGLKGGTETVYYKIIDPSNVHDSISSISISVQENLQINVTSRSGLNKVCVGDTAYLNTNLNGGVWRSQNSNIATIVNNNRVFTKQEGNVLISYKLDKSSFCKDSIATKNLSVVLPKIKLTSGNLIINGSKSDTTVLSASIINDSIKPNSITYYWKINNSVFQTNNLIYKRNSLKSNDTLSVFYQSNSNTSNICSQNKLIVSDKIVYNKDTSIVKSTLKDITQFKINGVLGIISGTDIIVNLPTGIDLTKLTAEFSISSGATIKIGTTTQLSGQTVNDFTSPITYSITAEDGSTKNYLISVKLNNLITKSSAKNFISFSIQKPSVVGEIKDTMIYLNIPANNPVNSVVTNFEVSPLAIVKLDTTVQVSGNSRVDLNKNLIYTVFAEDGTFKRYSIVVNYLPAKSSACELLSLGIGSSNSGKINGSNAVVYVPKDVSLSKIILNFTASPGATVKVNNILQVSGSTINNFNSSLSYTVLAEDGVSSKTFIVSVYQLEKLWTSDFSNQSDWKIDLKSYTGAINWNITSTMPTSNSLKVWLDSSGNAFNSNSKGNFAQVNPSVSLGSYNSSIMTKNPVGTSGKSNVFLSFYQLYKKGIDTAKVEISSDSISWTSFNYNNKYARNQRTTNPEIVQIDISSVAANKSKIWVKFTQKGQGEGTDYAWFIDDVSIESKLQNDTTQTPKSTACDLISFRFTTPAVTGVIAGMNISLTVPSGTNVSNLIAQFTASTGSIVKVGNTNQVSGQTANDFTNTVSYVVTAEDGSKKTYLVTVIFLPALISGEKSICQNTNTQLSANVEGSKTRIPWVISDTSIAKISTTGQLSGLKPGKCYVTFYDINNTKTSDTINVLASSISGAGSITVTSLNCVGDTGYAVSTIQGGVWSTLDTSVVKILNTGKIVTKKDGEANILYTISGSTKCDLKQSTMKVIVNALVDLLPIEGVTTICKNASTELSSQTTNGTWTWESENPEIATVLNGHVEGKAVGKTKITYIFTQNGCKSTTSTVVTIVDLPQNPVITGNSMFCLGTSNQLMSNKNKGKWSTLDSTIATVDTNGLVISKQIGKTDVFYSVAENGCVASVKIGIQVVPNLVSSTESKTACTSYTWNNQTYTQSGVYTFTTKGKSGCDSTATLNLTILPASTSTESKTACTSYTWNNQTYTQSGVYTFTTKGKSGCDSTATLNLTILPASTSTESKTACTSYTWNNQTYTQSGVYTFTTKGKSGCDSTATLNLIIAVPISDLKISGDSLINVGDKVLLFSNYNGSWSITPSNFALIDSTGKVTAIKEGTVQVILTINSKDGCISTTTKQLTINPKVDLCSGFFANLISENDRSGDAKCTGKLSSNVGGGIQPYSYAWSTGATTANLTDLCAQTYTLEVTDKNNCKLTVNKTVGMDSVINPCANFKAFISSVEPTGINVTTCNGSVGVKAEGGQAPYSYVWNNGVKTAAITEVCQGEYKVTVTDKNNCSISLNAKVAIDSTKNACNGFYAKVLSVQDDNGSCIGEIQTQTFGGKLPYSYKWNTSSTDSTLTQACKGVYTLEVMDANKCSFTLEKEVKSTAVIDPCKDFYVVVSELKDDVSEVSCNGKIVVQAKGGKSPYRYAWESGDTTSILENKCAGSYSATIIDANNCKVSVSTSISKIQPQGVKLDAVITTKDASSLQTCDGSMSIQVTSGTAPYMFSHSNGETGSQRTSLCSGVYTVTVKDAIGNEQTLNYVISNPVNTIQTIVNTLKDSVSIDTLKTKLQNECSIEYDAIDSVKIKEIMILPKDSILVTWTVYAKDKQTFVSKKYVVNKGEGVYTLALSMYCKELKGIGSYFTASQKAYLKVGGNTTTSGITSIESPTMIRVYPNPFTDKVEVSMTEVSDYHIELMDITGKRVYNQEFKQTKHMAIDFSQLSSGEYLLKLTNKDNVQIRKISRLY